VRIIHGLAQQTAIQNLIHLKVMLQGVLRNHSIRSRAQVIFVLEQIAHRRIYRNTHFVYLDNSNIRQNMGKLKDFKCECYKSPENMPKCHRNVV
jgi:hypothetical protein